MAHAEVTARAFSRPEGFDAIEYLNKALATMPRGTPTEVLLLTELETARREVFNSMGVCETCGEGVMLTGSADDLEWYARS